MTVIRGKVWLDHEFPTNVYGYHADRDSPHDFGTPFQDLPEVKKQVDRLKSDKETYRLRVAYYKLVMVDEIECAGERPKEESDGNNA